MLISVGKSNSEFVPREASSVDEVSNIITSTTYSLSIFKDNYRKAENFIKAEAIGLDFDDGMTLQQAIETFADYKHIIATTRNHQKEKNGKVCDRFRVILCLDKPALSHEQFTSVYESLLKVYPQADHATKDPSRMFYQSTKVVSVNAKGKKLKSTVTRKKKKVSYEPVNVSVPAKGWTSCAWNILSGNFVSGEGNEAMMSLSTFCRSQGFSKEVTTAMCLSALERRHFANGAKFNEADLKREVIDQVFLRDAKVHYSCKKEGTWLHKYCNKLDEGCEPKSSLNVMSLKDLNKSAKKLNWVVDGLFTEGGLSLIAGPPKSGKSTLARQLVKSVINGEDYLKRKTIKGTVTYLALEEQEAILKDQYKKIGMKDDPNFKIHVGPIMAKDPFQLVDEYLSQNQTTLLIIDTLFLFAKVGDTNNYNEVNKELEKIRSIARAHKCHISCIHHTNKSRESFGARSIHGSQAIHGAVDCAFIVNQYGEKRVLNTSQRGGVPFSNVSLIFDKKKETYSIGGYHDSANGF